MHLTGRAGGPALSEPARLALALDAIAVDVAESSGALGGRVDLDGPALLGERAALVGLQRNGSTSCGGACRLVRAADGTIAISLARETDIQLLPAWLEDDAVAELIAGLELGDAPWDAIADAVRSRASAALVEQATLLGIPCGRVGEVTCSAPFVAAREVERALRAPSLDDLVVADLSALWAGPLCAHVLGLAGAQVVKVESAARPDGARRGPQAFYDLLHAGHRSVVLDFDNEADRAMLRRLLRRADVVIEASRPRALVALGASYDHLREDGWRGLWTTITAHGSDGAAAMRTGFGDDAAAAGGLVVESLGDEFFVADAVADPTTGLVAAAATLAALRDGVTAHLSLSLAGTAAHFAAGIARHGVVDAGLVDGPAALPRARRATRRAAPMGAHTDEVLRAL